MSNQPVIFSDALEYDKYGEPLEVVKLTKREINGLKDCEILVKMLAASINPSDILVMQGFYPIKPPLPAIGGNEGVGQIVEVGSSVSNLSVGDLVYTASAEGGTWQTYLCRSADEWLQLDKRLPRSTAAMIGLNPSTAYIMLKKFVNLQPGDLIIQNGSTGAVGSYVMQIAKLMELKSVNLFRTRDTEQDTEKTRQHLIQYGATWALTHEEFTSKDHPSKTELAKYPSPKLGLNCTGDQSTLVEALDPSGCLVSYGDKIGDLTTPSVTMETASSSNLNQCTFWIADWMEQANRDQVEKMMGQIMEWFLSGQLKPSKFVEVPLEDWKKAISMSSLTDKKPTLVKDKVVLVMK